MEYSERSLTMITHYRESYFHQRSSSMTRKIVHSILFSATLLVSLAAVATAQDDRICSTPGLTGEWGYTSTGAFIFPTGAVPFAFVGRLTFDTAGNFSGAQNSSTGGQVGQDN